VYLPSKGNTDRTHATKNTQNAIKLSELLEEIMGAFCAPPSDIRGNFIFLRGRFALCPGVFPTLIVYNTDLEDVAMNHGIFFCNDHCVNRH